MGSRKKSKKEISLKDNFINWYKALNPNDKIAFKCFYYRYGRSRVTLQDLLKHPYNTIIRSGQLVNVPFYSMFDVEQGYEWWHHRDVYYRIRMI